VCVGVCGVVGWEGVVSDRAKGSVAAAEMPPVELASFGAALWLGEDGTGSSSAAADHNPCYNPPDELKDCVKHHVVRLLSAHLGALIVPAC